VDLPGPRHRANALGHPCRSRLSTRTQTPRQRSQRTFQREANHRRSPFGYVCWRCHRRRLKDHSCTTPCLEQLSYAICRLTDFLFSLILPPFEGGALRRILIVLVLVSATVPLSRTAGASSVTVAAAGDIARPSFGTPQQQTA